MQKSHFLTIALLFSVFTLFSQSDYNIKLKTGLLETKRNTTDLSSETGEYEPYLSDGFYYVITQFEEIPREMQIKDLEQKGIFLLSYLPNYAYITKIKQETFQDNETWKKDIRHISPYLPDYKLPTGFSETSGNCFLQVLFQKARLKTSLAENI